MRNTNSKVAAALVWAAALLYAGQSRTSAAPAQDTNIKTACDAFAYTTAAKAHLASLAQQLAKAPEHDETIRRKYTIAAAAAQDEVDACLLAAIAAHAAKRQKDLETAVAHQRQKVVKALAAIGPYAETAKVAATLAKLTYDIPNTNGAKKASASKLYVKVAPKTADTNSCYTTDPTGIIKFAGNELDVTKLNKFHSIQTGKHQAHAIPAIVALTNGGSCDDGGSWTTFATAATSCNEAGAVSTIAPAIETDATAHAEPTTATKHVFANDDYTQGCKSETEIEQQSPGEGAALHAICAGLTAAVPSEAPTVYDGPTLSKLPDIAAAAQACLPYYKDKSKLTAQQQTALTKFLEKAYTASSSSFESKFKPLVDNAYVQVYRGGKVESVKISDITTPEEEHNALNRLRAKQAAAKLASSQDPATPDQK
uniref:Variant surface glycoprotein 1125.4940 n=1 Tax=Trypanosoma brucei TaxID=5691 RepID=A0A1J0RB54_9TRYP|nr:variant surface glycoprotein 1125.4940 [Trypanosoma brucei]